MTTIRAGDTVVSTCRQYNGLKWRVIDTSPTCVLLSRSGVSFWYPRQYFTVAIPNDK